MCLMNETEKRRRKKNAKKKIHLGIKCMRLQAIANANNKNVPFSNSIYPCGNPVCFRFIYKFFFF